MDLLNKEVVFTARTVEEAKACAIEELGVKDSEVDFEIMDEGSRGIFGLGFKQAKVKVIFKVDPAKVAEEFLKEILKLMNLDIKIINKKQEGKTNKFVLGGENMGVLIGKKGKTLDALQFILNIVANKNCRTKNDRKKFILDGEDYRSKREVALKSLAEKMAEKVIKEKRDIVLEPMLPYERRIIHLYLQKNPNVITYSKGDDPLRRVVISPRK